MDITVGSTLSWAWPLILTAIALVLTSVVNQPSWSPQAKKLATIIVAGVVGAVYAIAAGLIAEVPDAWSQIVTRLIVVAAIILVCGQAVYQFLKSPLTKIESATAITPALTTAEGDAEDVSADAAPDVADDSAPESADDVAAVAADAAPESD